LHLFGNTHFTNSVFHFFLDVNLKEAAKILGKKMASGVSVTKSELDDKEQCITLQGNKYNN